MSEKRHLTVPVPTRFREGRADRPKRQCECWTGRSSQRLVFNLYYSVQWKHRFCRRRVREQVRYRACSLSCPVTPPSEPEPREVLPRVSWTSVQRFTVKVLRIRPSSSEVGGSMLVPLPLHVDQTLETAFHALPILFQQHDDSSVGAKACESRRPDSLQLRSSGSNSGRRVLPWVPLTVPTSEQHGQEPGTAGRAWGRQATDGF